MESSTSNNQPNNSDLNQQQGTEIAAFILGIASLVLSLSIYSGGQFLVKMGLGITCAIVGLILGITVNKVKRTKMGTTAIVTSVISLCVYLISIFTCSACAIIGCAYVGALFQ